jgi:hypothetical protein
MPIACELGRRFHDFFFLFFFLFLRIPAAGAAPSAAGAAWAAPWAVITRERRCIRQRARGRRSKVTRARGGAALGEECERRIFAVRRPQNTHHRDFLKRKCVGRERALTHLLQVLAVRAGGEAREADHGREEEAGHRGCMFFSSCDQRERERKWGRTKDSIFRRPRLLSQEHSKNANVGRASKPSTRVGRAKNT